MMYVQRDKNGVVCGVYANPQPQPDGSCLTDPQPIPDNHPDLIGFRAKLLAFASVVPVAVPVTTL